MCCILSVPALVLAETPIKITDAWAPASPPTAMNVAVYLTLTNQGQAADRLVGASGGVSDTVELHTVLMEDNMMKMRQLDAIEVPAGPPTMLKPGGFHIMLIGLKQPLVAGQMFPLRLRFEKAGEMTVEVPVRKSDASRSLGDASSKPRH
jgi:copper(I)-binding protein